MPKIYNIHIYDDLDSFYVCYHIDNEGKYLYLVNIDNDAMNAYRFVRIDSADKNKKEIYNYSTHSIEPSTGIIND